jgi:hypothetical protein
MHGRPRPLFRAAIENCGVGAIPIDEINGAVDLSSKCEIPDQRSVRKLTQRMGLDAIALWLRVQKLANTYFGLDLIGRNPRFSSAGSVPSPLHGAFWVNSPSSQKSGLSELLPARASVAVRVRITKDACVIRIISLPGRTCSLWAGRIILQGWQ